MIAAAIVGAVVVLWLVAIVLRKGADAERDRSGSHARGRSSPVKTLELPTPILDDDVAHARAELEAGNYAVAIEALARIEADHPTRADVHALLMRAFAATKKTNEALREAAAWIDASAPAAREATLQELVRSAAASKESADAAFALAEGGMKEAGADLLCELAWAGSPTQVTATTTRARAALAKPDVRAHASPALAVLLSYREAKTCEARRALLSRAKDDGDLRLVPVLKLSMAASGCGFLKLKDCNSCLRRDHVLTDAIAAIEARVKP